MSFTLIISIFVMSLYFFISMSLVPIKHLYSFSKDKCFFANKSILSLSWIIALQTFSPLPKMVIIELLIRRVSHLKSSTCGMFLDKFVLKKAKTKMQLFFCLCMAKKPNSCWKFKSVDNLFDAQLRKKRKKTIKFL